MDLVAIRIQGWRKFKEQTTLQTNGKLISILGPNEAGKSSLLSALNFLDSDYAANASDISRGKSREDLLIEAFFTLAENDAQAAGLTGSHRVVLWRTADQIALLRLEPSAPRRSLRLRKSAAATLERVLNNRKYIERLSEEQVSSITNLRPILNSESEDLREDERTNIKEVASRLRAPIGAGWPEYVYRFPDQLANLSKFESEPNPHEQAHRAIQSRCPDFLFFSDQDRDLHQEYSLESLAADVPTALANLADIGGLDIRALVSAVNDGDAARVETLRARANRKLRKRFQETWSQSGVRTSFVLKDRTLQVLIENDNDEFTALAERSDGFRQFVALQSFVLKQRARNPILLIDEAESHLHYDAQADLIQMLAKQEVSSKVIYTTHSAGALPEDLGNGVRLVTSSSGDPYASRIVNRFWGGEQTGFSPLLIGMGASTLAFFPTRRALLVEGETEMLLLPSVFRQCADRSVLGFQVVPGLAKAAKGLLPMASSKSSHICYLVDGDNAGKAIGSELRKAGADPDSILSWVTKDGVGLEFEDLLENKLLLAAAEKLVDRFSPGVQFTPPKQMPATGKIKAIAKAYVDCSGKALSKVDLAYEVLGIVHEVPTLRMVESKRKALVMETLSRIEVRLGLETAPNA